MWFDGFLFNHPGKHRRRPVSCIANKPLRGEIETLLDPLDHDLGGFDFRRAVGLQRANDLVEYPAEGATVAEPPVPILGEGGMVRYRIFQAKAAEPAVGHPSLRRPAPQGRRRQREDAGPDAAMAGGGRLRAAQVLSRGAAPCRVLPEAFLSRRRSSMVSILEMQADTETDTCRAKLVALKM